MFTTSSALVIVVILRSIAHVSLRQLARRRDATVLIDDLVVVPAVDRVAAWTNVQAEITQPRPAASAAALVAIPDAESLPNLLSLVRVVHWPLHASQTLSPYLQPSSTRRYFCQMDS